MDSTLANPASKVEIKPSSRLSTRVGSVARFWWDRLRTGEYWRNTLNYCSMYGMASGIADGVLNGTLTTGQMVGGRMLSNFLNIAGASDLYTLAHRAFLKKCGVNPQTHWGKRTVVNAAFSIVGDGVWNMGMFGAIKLAGAVGLAAPLEHYWRSVGISTVVGVPLFFGVVAGNARLNYLATSDKKPLEIFSERIIKRATRAARTPRQNLGRYCGYIALMNGIMLGAWVYGPKLHKAVADIWGASKPAAQAPVQPGM